ncbi:CDP-glycerol glycerophosphotransferase family protein [Neobacillus sp. CF12]|uniref:CDP-glycerol glycerophosphotransferase family protein n=1 Tax=Neobacillus sp. CF12 TaxID=3055864 RepID=UPI0025A168EF|nr:CDP-glycerol glycerophosphotransferase family protein [Neobacillus sp. CF12]MDM5329815.1 CDP-glycerol glycerophosphotransferase family protein [Neobacillus sp. CF12]
MKKFLTNRLKSSKSLVQVQTLKEILKIGYLLLFKVVFSVCKLSPQKNKLIFVISFEENAFFIYQELLRQKAPFDIVVLCKPTLYKDMKNKFNQATIIPFESRHLLNWLRSIYHLATSRIILIDNYFAFLSTIQFKKNVQCIQLWHAAGAFKKFGLQDQSIVHRRNIALKRFRKVYSKFDKIIIGSESMANIFTEAFDVPQTNFLRTGIPRTDLFYDLQKQEQLRKEFIQKYPAVKGKKVILYAPTFRDTQLANYQIQLDIDNMYKSLKQDFILIIKLHPAVQTKTNYAESYPGFVYDFSSHQGINELLVNVDYLITDYSSIPFEYALLKRPMIFYPYDLTLYQKDRGVIENYQQEVPGPIAYDSDTVISLILNNKFNLDLVCQFSSKWNQYSTGHSSAEFVRYIVSQ